MVSIDIFDTALFRRVFRPTAFGVLLKNYHPELSEYVLPRTNAEYLELETVKATIRYLLTIPDEFCFYGAGTLYEEVMEQYPVLSPVYVIDRNPSVRPKTGRKPSQLEWLDICGLEPVYVLVLHNTDQIVADLRAKGIDARKLH